jgi:hypothetical protein
MLRYWRFWWFHLRFPKPKYAGASESAWGQVISLDRRYVNTAITTILHMLALHMAITARNGLAEECLLEPGRGIALDGAMHTTIAGMIATDSMVAATHADTMTAADIEAGTAMATSEARASAKAAVRKDSTAVEVSTAVAVSMAVAVSTVVAGLMVVAVTGKPKSQ